MSNESNQDQPAQTTPLQAGVSIGSGIAIFASLMFGGGLTVFLVLFNFSDTFVNNSETFDKMAKSDEDIINLFVLLLILFITALPAFSSYKLAEKIVEKS